MSGAGGVGWGSLLRPRDARGRESRTLALVGVSWLLVTAKFILDSFGPPVGFGPYGAAVSPVDYAAATAALLAVWLGREWVDARRNSDV
ncbi:MAG: hypothetical protein V9G63_16355 [Candidatus Competibacter sp.]|jgi:hypothetical protein